MNVQQALARLLDGHNLSRAEARLVMNEVMSGEATPAQIGGHPVALRLKGETAEEIDALEEAVRRVDGVRDVDNRLHLPGVPGASVTSARSEAPGVSGGR